jgi:hypothetical protein
MKQFSMTVHVCMVLLQLDRQKNVRVCVLNNMQVVIYVM